MNPERDFKRDAFARGYSASDISVACTHSFDKFAVPDGSRGAPIQVSCGCGRDANRSILVKNLILVYRAGTHRFFLVRPNQITKERVIMCEILRITRFHDGERL